MSEMERQGNIFLRASREIEAVKRHGRRMSTELFNLLSYRTGEGPTRMAIVVGKRFGNAVRRNRAKRVFRALVRRCQSDLVPGQDVVVFPKRDALVQPHDVLTHTWETALRRVKILRPKPE
jgi:ribonuclease P protein component